MFLMRFLKPEYFQLFLLLPIISFLWIASIIYKCRAREKFGALQKLKRVSRTSQIWQDVSKYILMNLVLISSIMALAYPQIIKNRQIVKLRGMDIVLLLDNSPSMRAQDVKPSRLDKAKEVIGNFITQKTNIDRVGLVSFTETSLILSYLTSDPDNILFYLDYLEPGHTIIYGTNIGRGIKTALSLLEKDKEIQQKATQNLKIFILVSDGEDHGEELKEAVYTAKKFGIRIYTIGIGSKAGAYIPLGLNNGEFQYLEDDNRKKIITRFEERTLRWIAKETGAKFYRSFTGGEIRKSLNDILLTNQEIKGIESITEYKDIYSWFLISALITFLIAMII